MIDLIHSDNRDALRELFHRGVKAQLAYLDPPFGTGKAQVGAAGSYDDTFIDIARCVREITETATACWVLLSDTGSLVIHLDHRLVHHVKVAMDRFVGVDRFASEIIWRYRRWPSKTRNFQRVHDTLLRYVRDPKQCVWNQLYEPLSPKTIATWGNKKQRAVWVPGSGKAQKLRRQKSSVGIDESPGVPMGDVWDIGIVPGVSRERTGYPTQKPEALLERLILACTNSGDLVLDPYCGSGTTPAVAQRLGRDAIGIDRNPQAIEVTQKRIVGTNAT